MVIKVPKGEGKKYCVTVIDVETGRLKTVCGSNLDKVVSAVESLGDEDVEIYFSDVSGTPYGEEEKESLHFIPKRQRQSTRFIKRETRKEEGFF